MNAKSRIRALVETKLVGRKVDILGFVDAILDIVAEAGEVHCSMPSEQTLRFELRDEVCDVELDSGRGKLRMVCARLSVLCNETANTAVSPYGGEGVIRLPSHNGVEPRECTVRFKNTPDQQEFAIIPAKIGKPYVAPTAR